MAYEELFMKNRARSTIAGTPLASGGTSVTVADGSVFPEELTPYTFHAPGEEPWLESTVKEIVLGTRVGDVLTIVRAQDGTDAETRPVGTLVNIYTVNLNFEKLNQGIIENRTVPSGEITVPVNDDEFTIRDSLASFVKKKVTRENMKLTLEAYFSSVVQTFTNKRITPRVTSEASSATPTINTNNCDIHRITALAANITSMTTNLSGTPTHGQVLIIEITGTATRTIAWGASFEASVVALPTATDGTNMLMVGFKWNSDTSKRRCMAAG